MSNLKFLTPQHLPIYHMPHTAQDIALVVFWAAAVISLAAAGWRSRHEGSWKPFLYVLGGGLTAINEPLLAGLTHVAHSQIGADVAFHANRVVVPWYALGAYVPYFAIAMLILVPLFERRALDLRGVYVAAGVVVVGVWVFEGPWIDIGLWHFYGRQSVQPFGLMPIWYAFTSAMLTFVPAAIVARVAHLLHGPRLLLLVPIVVMSSFAAEAGVAWPMWLVNSSDWSGVFVQLGALMAIAQTVLLVWLLAPYIARQEPAPAPGAPTVSATEYAHSRT